MRRVWPIVAVAIALLVSAPALVYAVQDGLHATDPDGSALWLVMSSVAYGALGILLALRRPSLAIPWLLLALGVCMAWSSGLSAVSSRWSVNAEHVDAALYVCFACLIGLIVQLFPTGRPLSRRWAVVTWSLAVGGGLIAAGQSLGLGDSLAGSPLGSPLRLFAAVAILAFAFGMLGSVPALVVRFHRARGAERAQLKWFLLGVVLMAAAWFAPDDLIGTGYRSVVNLGGLAPVIAIAIALLRYRLYDIDRIISRTASYAIVTALVISTYAVVVTTVTSLLPNSSSSLAVAAATLTGAALARPLLQRVQRIVDRRFDRTHYNRLATINAFGEQARHLVDSEDVVRGLLTTVDRSLQPASVALFVRTPS